jgi:hypothetical protein
MLLTESPAKVLSTGRILRKRGHAGQISARNGRQHALQEEHPTTSQRNENEPPDPPPVSRHV